MRVTSVNGVQVQARQGGNHRKPVKPILYLSSIFAISCAALTLLTLGVLSQININNPPAGISYGTSVYAAPAAVAAPAQNAQDTGSNVGYTPARRAHARAAALPRSYRVRAGDTLSLIAKRLYGSSKVSHWTAIYWSNRGQIKYANLIYTGQLLSIPALTPHAPAAPANMSPPAPKPVTVRVQSDDPDSGSTESSSAQQTHTSSNAPTSGYQAPWSFQECVKMHENGGSYSWDTGNGGGAYQFLFSTWVAAGGAPSMYGSASPGYQDAVFEEAYKLWGTSPWSPYDGC